MAPFSLSKFRGYVLYVDAIRESWHIQIIRETTKGDKEMIIRDSQLTTKEEIQLRINSIQKQLDKEIYSSTRSNAISAKIRKDEKIRKLNERMGILITKLRKLKAL